MDGTCDQEKASINAARISEFVILPSNNELAILQAVATQPVSVSLDATGHDLQFYAGRVFTGQCGTNLSHDVTAIGLFGVFTEQPERGCSLGPDQGWRDPTRAGPVAMGYDCSDFG